MKKNLLRMLALALAVCLVLALGACGGSNTDNSKADNSTPVSSGDNAPVSSAVTGGTPNADGKYATVADLVMSDEMQSQLAGMKEQFGDIGASLDIAGEGNKLIYTFVYEDLGGQDEEAISTALETAMEQMASVFETIAGSLAEQVEAANPTVVVTYKTAEGTELFSKEYSAK